MKKVLLFTLCASVAASSATFAQSTKSRYASRDKASAQTRPLMDDRAFLLSAAQGAFASIELSRLAATKASSGDVRRYAETITDSSEKMNAALLPLLKEHDVTAPAAIDTRHKVSRDWLANL